MLLWDILFRGQLGFSISFLEEMWSRNIGNLMMSPLRPIEFIIALMVMSVVRLSIGAVPVTFLAIAFFGFNLYRIGLGAGGVLFQSGDADQLGDQDSLSLRPDPAQRHGRGKSRLVDHVSVHALNLRLLPGDHPGGLAAAGGVGVAADLCLRSGMRTLWIDKVFRLDLDARCKLALNAVLFAAGVFGFLKLLESARRHGSLMQTGE